MVTTKTQSFSPHKIHQTENNNLINNQNGNDGDLNNQISYQRVADFYKNSVVFITGGTGFIGKALVEKLLRSCDQVENIYLLLRPKRGLCVEQRLKELIKNPVSTNIKKL